jgi:hypothetical protein
MLDAFTKGRPGRRFRNLYRLKRASPGGRFYRCAAIAVGFLLCLMGLFFLAVPGPGIPILLFGATLLAQQSLGMALMLDRTEVRLRRLFRSKARGSRTRPASPDS